MPYYREMRAKVSVREILQKKESEIARHKKELPPTQLENLLEQVTPPRGFEQRLREAPFGLIAEIKRASPSEGELRDVDPPSLAARLDRSKATCLSILTDVHFRGDLAHLRTAHALTHKPLLRKDFLLDPYQVLESRVFGADAVLLIAACLTKKKIRSLFQQAKELDLDVLIELHEVEDIQKIPDGATLLGMNNRSLFSKDYTTSLEVTKKLLPLLPRDRTIIAESGIETPQQTAWLASLGIRGALIGTALMRSADPVAKIAELLSQLPPPSQNLAHRT